MATRDLAGGDKENKRKKKKKKKKKFTMDGRSN